MTCPTCQSNAALGSSTWAVTRGYCSNACYLARPAGAPVVETSQCRYCQTVITYEYSGMGRRGLTLCGAPECRRARWRIRDKRRRDKLAGKGEFRVHAPEATRLVKYDLPAEKIDAILASRAAHRKATRSWLRIADPWAQRPGSELHNRTDVMTYDLEGRLQ